MAVGMLSCSVVSDSLRSHGLQPTRIPCPWDSPGKNIGMGCHFLLQGIPPTQAASLHLLLSIAGGLFTSVPAGKFQESRVYSKDSKILLIQKRQ